ncbi:gliding motility-associated C-terminal domain-containing protein [Mucilaginibacter sp. OK098]|uniref:NHL domain-containing protein n=1 Tax=Mucilaginibacter sp. OK098 TaxID=1855297 RepID=UPI000911E8B6|nr:gliding motility-associated C-terminal domain-containing protein [Mucilaginibacter sp. OK098]SHN10595.1 gliding motility-associated C-terminal domain-containing protein [Mucilaginibacter sp. OK098]
MPRNKLVVIIYVFILCFLNVNISFAQAPNISYPAHPVYTINSPIPTLIPNNSGGAVPATIYGEVSTFAGGRAPVTYDSQGTDAGFNLPSGIVAANNGIVYVTDFGSGAIRKITPNALVTTIAHVNSASGIVADNQENLFITDFQDNKIFKINTAGITSVFAGTGASGAVNGPANIATFHNPGGIAIDASGNLYVADQQNNMIREITSAGVVSTFAGSGAAGIQNGPALSAKFNSPDGVAVDGLGNVYVADTKNSLIRKITPVGVVSIVVGTGSPGMADGASGSASFNYPTSVIVDAQQNLYIADYKNNKIRKIAPDGIVSTIAGNNTPGSINGIGTAASFNYPLGLTINSAGEVYITDEVNYLIRKLLLTGYTIDKPLPPGLIFDPETGKISGTPTELSPATDYTVTAYNADGTSSTIVNIEVKDSSVPQNPGVQPPKITYHTPNTYTINTAISTLSPNQLGGAVPAGVYGDVTTFAGLGSPGTNTGFNGPAGVVTDNAGNLYVSDANLNLIRKVTPDGTVTTLAGGGNGVPGNADGIGTLARFNNPGQLAIDAAGNIYVADSGNNLIRKITPDATVTTYAGTGQQGSDNGPRNQASFYQPTGIVIDASGNIFVSDLSASLIRKITPAGTVSVFAGGFFSPVLVNGNGANASFFGPWTLAIDAAGNLYVADHGNAAVRKITPAADVSTFAGTGQSGSSNGNGQALSASFTRLLSVAVDASGNIYTGDAYSIRKITPSGAISTFAGSLSGSGLVNGPKENAKFYSIFGLTFDKAGNLFIADKANNVVRKIALSGYTIDKALPAGLVFDAATGNISGTPTALSPATDYTVTAYNAGGSSSTIVTIKVIASQTITFAPIPDKTVCDIDFDPGATGGSPITYTSSNMAVATIVQGKVHITGPGTTIITASDGTLTSPQTLTVIAGVTPSVTISPVTFDECSGIAVTYTATLVNGGPAPHYQWKVNGQNSGPDNVEFISSNLNNNDKITCVLTSSVACTSSPTATSNEAIFTLDPPVSTAVSITSSLNGPVCAGTEIVFKATPDTPDSKPGYQWQVNGNNAGTNSSIFSSKTLADGDIVTCILTSTGKCLINPGTSSNAIIVKLSAISQCVIVIPNTFTPNGDGINDFWNITALHGYPNCSITVFTRYGSVIYKSTGYVNAWDGTCNGSALPVGTYYYILDVKNGKKPLSGYVTILR